MPQFLRRAIAVLESSVDAAADNVIPAGKATLEETNAALAAAEAGYTLAPGKNALTEAEIRATTVGVYPNMANGWGLLDTGTGTLDKVQVTDGRLVNMDCGTMFAQCYIAGKLYEVKGAALTD